MNENRVVYMVARVSENGDVMFDLNPDLAVMERIAKKNNEAIVRTKAVDARVLEVECFSLLHTQITRGMEAAKQIRIENERAGRVAELRKQMATLQEEIDELE